MPLISTRPYRWQSIEYHKIPLSIERFEFPTEIWKDQQIFGNYFSLPIDEFIRQFGRRLPVFIGPIKNIGLLESSAFDIELIEYFYIFINPIEIKRFLLTNDHLIRTLFEAHRQIKRIFREDIVELTLEYDRDPEEDFEGLSIIIKTNLSPGSSLDLLNKFDEEWWLDVDDKIRMVLTVMVRPI